MKPVEVFLEIAFSLVFGDGQDTGQYAVTHHS